MINYTWFFDEFTVLTEYEGRTNVIQTVHWKYSGINEDGVFGVISGSTDIPPPYDAFVNFELVTFQMVENWLTATMGADTIQSFRDAIEEQINEQVSPKKLKLKAPWLVNE